MTRTFVIQNLKCGGCANTITKKLSQDYGNVHVDMDTSSVTLDMQDEGGEPIVRDKLLKLGYPVEGESLSSLQDLKAKGKSFVSCAVGRMSD